MAIAEIQTKSAPVIPALKDVMINGMSPFWSDRDAADERIEEAHALLVTLAGAFLSADRSGADTSDIIEQRGEITGRALEGIASLIARSAHHRSAARAASVAEEA